MRTLTDVRHAGSLAWRITGRVFWPAWCVTVTVCLWVLRADGRIAPRWDTLAVAVGGLFLFLAITVPAVRSELRAERQRQWQEGGGFVVMGTGHARASAEELELGPRVLELERRLDESEAARVAQESLWEGWARSQGLTVPPRTRDHLSVARDVSRSG